MDIAEVLQRDENQAELVNIDTHGNVIVNKSSDANSKLVARRAIEAFLERKNLEQAINEYYWDEA